MNSKYSLKRKTHGWKILSLFQGVIQTMFSQANDLVWQNYNVYKQYFYQHLFMVKLNLQQAFNMRADPVLDDLNQSLAKLLNLIQ